MSLLGSRAAMSSRALVALAQSTDTAAAAAALLSPSLATFAACAAVALTSLVGLAKYTSRKRVREECDQTTAASPCVHCSEVETRLQKRIRALEEQLEEAVACSDDQSVQQQEEEEEDAGFREETPQIQEEGEQDDVVASAEATTIEMAESDKESLTTHSSEEEEELASSDYSSSSDDEEELVSSATTPNDALQNVAHRRFTVITLPAAAAKQTGAFEPLLDILRSEYDRRDTFQARIAAAHSQDSDAEF